MKRNKARTIVPVAIIAVITLGFILGLPMGTVSAFGWKDISLLCPLGALSSMLAAKTAAPRPLIALAIALVLILIFGRAFCAYICPTPLLSRIRGTLSKKGSAQAKAAGADEQHAAGGVDATVETSPAAGADMAVHKPLTAEERALLGGCASRRAAAAGMGHKAIDSRHFVLLGALLSAVIFGFPVFCLICPIGLTFATILLLVALFGGGDVTIAVILCPLILVLEVVVFRKWCTHICPLSALMSLVAKGNRTFQPVVDEDKCIKCERCVTVCDQGINLLDPEHSVSVSECTRCRACVENCPTGALSMPLLRPKVSRRPDDPTPGQATTAQD